MKFTTRQRLLLLASCVVTLGLTPIHPDGKATHHETDVVDKIDRLSRSLFTEDAPGGVILAAKEGRVVYHEAFGKSNLELAVASDTNTVYSIASNAKPFTAVAILKLAEDGLLSLSDPITDYIPDYPVVGENVVKIEHLLTHTSGIASFNGLDDSSKGLEYSHAEFVGHVKKEDLAFSPGSDFSYSNSDYYLLGYIIEQVTGLAHGEYLQSAFFGPLGMSHTRLADENQVLERRADGYYQEDTGYSRARHVNNTFTQTPEGGLQSTAHDLFKWYSALGQGAIIGKKSMEAASQLFELSDGSHGRTGYGWFVGSLGTSRFLTRNGSGHGFSSSLVYLPEQEIFAVILTNCNWRNSGEYINAPLRVASILMGADYVGKSTHGSDTAAIQGLYESSNGESLVLFAKDGVAFLQDASGRQVRLFELGKNMYFSEHTYTTIEWVPGSRWDNSTIVLRTDSETTYEWVARVEIG